jgi:hypothetical protein
MFSKKNYLEINREERFYCFLLAHAILSSNEFRKRLTNTIHPFDMLNPDNIAVYIEAAALRDYWNDLGEPLKYDVTTAQNRMKVLHEILAIYGLDDCLSNPALSFFWTSNNLIKLWNPGKWEISKEEKEILGKTKYDLMKKIKWAFNAKPDILLVSNNAVVMIEAKYESGEGKNEETGYEQLKIQRDYIGKIMRTLIPVFSNKEFKHVYLTKKDSTDEKEFVNIHWSTLKEKLRIEDVDKFTFDCFQRF